MKTKVILLLFTILALGQLAFVAAPGCGTWSFVIAGVGLVGILLALLISRELADASSSFEMQLAASVKRVEELDLDVRVLRGLVAQMRADADPAHYTTDELDREYITMGLDLGFIQAEDLTSEQLAVLAEPLPQNPPLSPEATAQLHRLRVHMGFIKPG